MRRSSASIFDGKALVNSLADRFTAILNGVRPVSCHDFACWQAEFKPRHQFAESAQSLQQWK
jgi:hypothetical protein